MVMGILGRVDIEIMAMAIMVIGIMEMTAITVTIGDMVIIAAGSVETMVMAIKTMMDMGGEIEAAAIIDWLFSA
ncbi:hypothetical protein [Crenothrix sp.]|uniref:hypothetical protein n=1 Tax=Crenothrix sp. TaxID=3100433 RepID=UPI00374DF373